LLFFLDGFFRGVPAGSAPLRSLVELVTHVVLGAAWAAFALGHVFSFLLVSRRAHATTRQGGTVGVVPTRRFSLPADTVTLGALSFGE
jgi:hypothetical protein